MLPGPTMALPVTPASTLSLTLSLTSAALSQVSGAEVLLLLGDQQYLTFPRLTLLIPDGWT